MPTEQSDHIGLDASFVQDLARAEREAVDSGGKIVIGDVGGPGVKAGGFHT